MKLLKDAFLALAAAATLAACQDPATEAAAVAEEAAVVGVTGEDALEGAVMNP